MSSVYLIISVPCLLVDSHLPDTPKQRKRGNEMLEPSSRAEFREAVPAAWLQLRVKAAWDPVP